MKTKKITNYNLNLPVVQAQINTAIKIIPTIHETNLTQIGTSLLSVSDCSLAFTLCVLSTSLISEVLYSPDRLFFVVDLSTETLCLWFPFYW